MKKALLLLIVLCTGINLALGLTTVLSEDFVNFTVANGSTDMSANLNSYLHTAGWTGSKIYQNAGEAKIGASSGLGYIVTPALDLSASSGNATLSFDFRQYGTDSGKFLQIFLATDGVNFVQYGADISIPAAVLNNVVSITGATANTKIKIAAKLASSNRFYLDNVLITQSSEPTIPVLSTAAISDITHNSAISGGLITSDGGAAIISRGVCWGTTSNPTILSNITSDGNGSGSYISNITGLNASTLYFVRAYAINSVGTGYGTEVSFSTSGVSPPSAPVATAATSITSNSFIANWDAAAGATSYRLDVSTSGSFSTLLSGYANLSVSAITQAVSGLSASTNYFYRVRAVNSNGTSDNSNIISLSTTISDPYNGYYNSVVGLTGNDLKTGLHNLIDNNTYSNYDGAKAYLFQDLDNTSNVVRCVYTGRDYTVSASYDGGSDPNTEHTFAQSWFGTSEASIKKADLHHLFPTSSTVNSSRGNLPFDTVVSNITTYPSYNGYVSKRGNNSAGQTVFEPASQHKGNLARALMYFSVRYNMSLSIDGVDMIPTLIAWHNIDAVDLAEQNRNSGIYTFQNNRNPFIDHPEYVSYIWGGTSPNTSIQFTPASIEVNENDGSITMSVAITNPSATTATTAQIMLTDGSAGDVSNYTTGSITFPAGSSANQSVTVNITDDALMEGNEILVFSLVNVSGGSAAVVGSYDTFNLTIVDNDLPTVTAIPATDLTTTGFIANWTAASGVTDYEFDLSNQSDFSALISGYSALIVTGTSLTVTGLQPGTDYYYRLRAIVNNTPGPDSTPILVTTNSTGDQTILLTTSFEGNGTAFPTGWTQYSSYVASNSANAHTGSYYAGENLALDWIATPILRDPNELTFWCRTSAASSNWTVIIQSSPDASNWADIASFSAVAGNLGTVTDTYSQKTIPLGLSGFYYLRWYMSTRTVGSMYFDDVTVTASSSVPILPAIPVAIDASNITSGSFTANWNAADLADNYRLDVSLSNSFATFVTGYEDLSVTGQSTTVTALLPGSTYYYRVRSENTAGISGSSNVITVITAQDIQTRELFISEYLEGGGNNKALEIYNPTAQTIDLSAYAIKIGSNGAAFSTSIFLTGSLIPGATHVIANVGANEVIVAMAAQTSSFVNFNGNDAIGLFCGTQMLDLIGIVGNDPVTGWSVAGTIDATKDHTLVRKSNVIHGNTNWLSSAGTDAPSSEWLVYPLDTTTYLGNHTIDGDTMAAPAVSIAHSLQEITLSWIPVSGAVSYRIEAAVDPDGSYIDVTDSGSFVIDAALISWSWTAVESRQFYRVISLR
jgi:endonuclease I